MSPITHAYARMMATTVSSKPSSWIAPTTPGGAPDIARTAVRSPWFADPALRKNPNDGPRTMEAFADALRAAAVESPAVPPSGCVGRNVMGGRSGSSWWRRRCDWAGRWGARGRAVCRGCLAWVRGGRWPFSPRSGMALRAAPALRIHVHRPPHTRARERREPRWRRPWLG